MQHVTAEDYCNPDIKIRIDDFNTKLKDRLDNTNFVLPGNNINFYYPRDIYNIPLQWDSTNGDSLEQDTPTDDVEEFDTLIGVTFLLDPLTSPGNAATKAKVIKCKTDHLGAPLGTFHPNPLLDTQ